MDRDWWRTKYASTGEEYNFTVAHWGITEGRFRKHVKAIKEEDAAACACSTTCSLASRRTMSSSAVCSMPTHRSFVPNFGCYIKAEERGKMKYYAVSRQMVLFAVERRKAWRMLQSKAGIVNKDYFAQKEALAQA